MRVFNKIKHSADRRNMLTKKFIISSSSSSSSSYHNYHHYRHQPSSSSITMTSTSMTQFEIPTAKSTSAVTNVAFPQKFQHDQCMGVSSSLRAHLIHRFLFLQRIKLSVQFITLLFTYLFFFFLP